MKRVLALLICCALLVGLFAACGNGGDTATTDEPADPPEANGAEETTDDETPEATEPTGDSDREIIVGVFQPFTGASGAGGRQEALGIQFGHYMQPTVEINGETYTIRLIFADNATSTERSPTAAQQLVADGAVAVLGSFGSALTMAASPIFENAGIPVIGPTFTNPQVTMGNEHVFRICFIDSFQGRVLAAFAIDELGAETIFNIAELGNDYDQGLSHYFRQAFEAAGGTVISESFPVGTADFTAFIASANAVGADAFFSPVNIANATQIVDQAAAQGLDMPILAGDTWDNNMIVQAAQDTDLEIFVSTFYQAGGNPEFDNGFRDWLNANPDMLEQNGGNDMIAAFSVMGFDAYNLLMEAFRQAGSAESGALLQVLPSVTWDGVAGFIEFNQQGDAIRNSAYVKTVDTRNNDWLLAAAPTVMD